MVTRTPLDYLIDVTFSPISTGRLPLGPRACCPFHFPYVGSRPHILILTTLPAFSNSAHFRRPLPPSTMLLLDLSPENHPPFLHLRLLHLWKLGTQPTPSSSTSLPSSLGVKLEIWKIPLPRCRGFLLRLRRCNATIIDDVSKLFPCLIRTHNNQHIQLCCC